MREERVYACQALGGTGALRLGLEFLKRFFPNRNAVVLISDPTWGLPILSLGLSFFLSIKPKTRKREIERG